MRIEDSGGGLATATGRAVVVDLTGKLTGGGIGGPVWEAVTTNPDAVAETVAGEDDPSPHDTVAVWASPASLSMNR